MRSRRFILSLSILLAVAFGASDAGCRYLGCAKTMALVGKAFAEAMLAMEKK